MKYVCLPLGLLMALMMPETHAQKTGSTLWLQAAGHQGMLSVQWDTRLSKSLPRAGLMAGAGLVADASGAGFTLPAGLYYLAGEKGHYLELGAGAAFYHFPKRNQDSWFNFEKENFLVPYASLGYRSEPAGKRRFFRAGLSYSFSDLRLPKILSVRNLVPAVSVGWKL